MKLKFKQKEIPFKSREDIEKEVTEILEGKGNHPHGNKLRQAAKVLSTIKTKEEIRELFIEEYVKKYGLLQTGKISLDQLKKESVEAVKKTGTELK